MAAEPPADGLIGGRYALGELLGVGGTGSVFAAIDATAGDGHEVAVKLLHPHLCADEASRDAFLREARHAMALSHPNVVRVHAAGLHDAAGVIMPWIALDLLHGPTLREWVDSVGRLSTADAAALADGMLAGLEAAHAAGVVHRDISPQNVILHGVHDLRTGETLTADMVRIVDFGLADVTGRSTLGSDVLLAGGGESGVIGNAAFMSPEQAQGRPVRAVGDLYQVGAVLYFALTGRPPFPRASTEQVLQAHVSAPPPVPSALAPAARPLDRIVTRAMAKTPAHRFRDAVEFREALRAAVIVPLPMSPLQHEEAPAPDDEPVEAPDSTRLLPSSATGGPMSYLSPTAAPDATPSTVNRSAGAGVAAAAAVVLIVGVALWAAVGANSTSADPQSSPSASSVVEPGVAPSASSTPSVPPSTVPTPTPDAEIVAPPPPAEVAVPALFGQLADADASLRAAGLTLAIAEVDSPEPAGRVLAQSPAAGTALAPGSAVTVTVASGNSVVPQVSGMTVSAASALLESAGFVADRSAGPTAIVRTTQPGAGTVLRVGVRVAFVTDSPTPTPTTTSSTPPPAESVERVTLSATHRVSAARPILAGGRGAGGGVEGATLRSPGSATLPHVPSAVRPDSVQESDVS